VIAVSPEREVTSSSPRPGRSGVPHPGDLDASRARAGFRFARAGDIIPVQMRTLSLLCAGSAAVALVAAGCGGSSRALGTSAGVAGAQHVLKHATVQTRTIKGLGTVLVNARGFTLYMFAPDKRKRVTCVATCARVWPPLKVKAGQKPTAGGAARKSLLGTVKDPSGGRVVTYNHWPLYTYIADTKPGQAKGQALNLNGGLWYVLSPSGKVIKKKLAAGGGYSGGY
jgi:predicted lipoprotein with Yx(FWY)xxD motif